VSVVPERRRYSPRRPRAQRREELLDAALRLLAAHGFGALSMEGIAREAGVAKTVAYDTFGTHEKLLRALFVREQERALATIAAVVPTGPVDGNPLDLLVQSLTTVLEAVRANPDTWRLILLPADGTPPVVRETVDRNRRRLVRQMQPLVAWGIDQLGLGDLDAELATNLILATSEDAARLTLTHQRRFPPERIARFAGDLLASLSR
jgi:AcrR family transcriptional regulator